MYGNMFILFKTRFPVFSFIESLRHSSRMFVISMSTLQVQVVYASRCLFFWSSDEMRCVE